MESKCKIHSGRGQKIKVAITNELIYPTKADHEVAFKQADPLAPFV